MGVNGKGHFKRRYAFIVPRFCEEMGGAETLVGNLASRLAERGNHVEIFATCARDNRTWENAFQPGNSIENGITIRRFNVDERDLESWIPKQIHISEGMNLSLQDQLDWMAESVNSSALYEHIASVQDQFEAFLFAPYLFGTTFWGSLINPEKSYLIPCLHNEHYAYTDVVGSMFRQVSGALFNCLPEQELASGLYGEVRGGEVGMGFDLYPEEEISALDPYFEENFPYLFYVGRKETGKNVQQLVDYFISLKEKFEQFNSLRLVVAGRGSFDDLHRPGVLERGDIVDLEHVSELEKRQLIRHALVLCQPSVNESFSIVLMEAWMLNTPVLVHADCAVTRHHVVESGGGLYYSSEGDFEGAVGELALDPDLGKEMGLAGKEYVRQKYDWEEVLKRFDNVMDDLLQQ